MYGRWASMDHSQLRHLGNPTYSLLLTCFQNSCTLFSKFLYTVSIANSDAPLLLYFILYVHLEYVAPTYKIEDRNLLPKPQKKLVKSYRSIHQNFTPSYAYNCLKACARSHHVLATKLTSYMNDQRNNWGGGDLLPAKVF